MVADPLGIKVIRAYGLNKAWLIGFLMDIFGALLFNSKVPIFLLFFLVSVFRVIFIAICLSIWWLELMVCHILDMGLSPQTAEEIFKDYSARRTDVGHALINEFWIVGVKTWFFGISRPNSDLKEINYDECSRATEFIKASIEDLNKHEYKNQLVGSCAKGQDEKSSSSVIAPGDPSRFDTHNHIMHIIYLGLPLANHFCFLLPPPGHLR